MNIEKIRYSLEDKKGIKMRFCFKGNRGQIDEYEGIITDIFQGIFLVKSIPENRVKSYSYSDVLIENLTFTNQK